jgi:hypothetical protein
MLAASSLKAALDRARRRGIVAHCRGWLETLARKKENPRYEHQRCGQSGDGEQRQRNI